MEVKGSVALVTGTNRALGAAFARGLLDDVIRAVRAPLSESTATLEPI